MNDQLPIHIAAIKGLQNNVELLLQCDPNVVDVLDNSDQSPLLLAAKNGFPNVVSDLLAKNANYMLKDKDALTAFDWSLRHTLPKVVEVFLNTDEWKKVNKVTLNNLLMGLPSICLLWNASISIHGYSSNTKSMKLFEFV